ncbi:MAG: SDR family oxidoreductase [Ruminococcaceae bacterium]|nr:SDR family oxidoreductase [Oscillospiraceae bacterium]
MKTAVITGAAKGIGAAIAVAFAKAGYKVVINYNKSEERARTLCQILNDTYPTEAVCIKGDVSTPDGAKKLISEAVTAFGDIDVLVNNAGIAQQKLFTDITDEDWGKMISTNLSSVFYVSREALPFMISKKSGSIVNISSIWGETGGSCEVHYSAAKAGVIGLTKALAKEVAPSGVTVNCVCPGVIKTDMLNSFTEDDLKALIDETPVMRLGSPKDVADAVYYLATNSGFVTGQVLGVNGGMYV